MVTWTGTDRVCDAGSCNDCCGGSAGLVSRAEDADAAGASRRAMGGDAATRFAVRLCSIGRLDVSCSGDGAGSTTMAVASGASPARGVSGASLLVGRACIAADCSTIGSGRGTSTAAITIRVAIATAA